MTSNNVHILILSSWYPTDEHPFLGNFVERQASLLATKYRVTVIHTEAKKNIDSIKIEQSSKSNFEEIRVYHPKGRHLLQRKKNQQKALFAGLTRTQQVNLIIGNVLFNRGLQFSRAKEHFNVPLIYVEHSSLFSAKNQSNWSWKERLVLKKVIPHVDEVVAVSDYLKNDMSSLMKTPITTIGNHVDTELFYYKAKESNPVTHFLHVSTMDVATKNPNGIFEAFSLLKESTSDFKLTIISDEPVEQWKQKAIDLNIEQQVEFHGPLGWNELPEFYHQAHAFVLFSHYETFSIVLAEAMATGTPLISTPVGIANNLSPEVGIQVGKDDIDDLASALLSFTREPNGFNTEAIHREGKLYSSATILGLWTQLIDRHVK